MSILGWNRRNIVEWKFVFRLNEIRKSIHKTFYNLILWMKSKILRLQSA